MNLELIVVLAVVLPVVGAFLVILAVGALCCNGRMDAGSHGAMEHMHVSGTGNSKSTGKKQVDMFGVSDGKSHGAVRTRSHENLLSSFRVGKRDSPLKHGRKVASTWKEPFLWSDNPSLIADATEHGWTAFGFVYTTSSSSSASASSASASAASAVACPVSLSALCIGSSGSHNLKQETEPKTSWEIGYGGCVEYMQQIWLNPGLGTKVGYVQSLRTALPLPGPSLFTDSFPSKCYLEITILAEGRSQQLPVLSSSSDKEDPNLVSTHPLILGKTLLSDMDPEKLIENHQPIMAPPAVHVLRNLSNGHHASGIFSSKGLVLLEKDAVKHQILAIGLASGRSPPFRLPGFDPGSVGFHSNGHVFLSGAACAHQGSKFPGVMKQDWNNLNTVIGCGFDPASRNVLFTLNGDVVHELNVLNDEFGSPLYPVVAANYDVTLIVNFGQTPFAYALANSQRVPDPSLHRPMTRSTKNGYGIEDSGELFSIGRIDSQLFEAGFAYTDDLQHRHVLSEADSELFEIVLDARP